MTKSLYLVTSSEVDTVKVGTYLIDDDGGRARSWYLYNPISARMSEGFHGKRTHILCDECWYRPTPLVRPYGHEHPHGEGPMLRLTSSSKDQ